MFIVDLRGRRQTDAFREVEERRRRRHGDDATFRPRKRKCRLTAVEPVCTNERGVQWLCLCDCGNTRIVAAKDFTWGRIRKCEECANPGQKRQQEKLTEMHAEAGQELGPPMYSEEFRRTWKERREGFSTAERLLYEVYLDGRTVWQLQMQAVDIVLRCEDIREWLMTFSDERIKRAAGRVRRQLTRKD